MSINPMLSIEEVTYINKKNKILNSVSFTVNKGEVLGIVGENGAGKSTILKIIAGLVTNHSGKVNFHGNNLGFLIEEPSLYNYRTGEDHLKYIMKINNCYNQIEYEEYTNLLEITHFLDKKIKKYSQGMKQKIGIVSAIIGNKSLIILDEPTNSLDYNSIPKLRSLINFLKNQGKTIIITSHLLLEIELLCDRVIIVSEGSIIDNFLVEDTEQDFEKYVIEKGL